MTRRPTIRIGRLAEGGERRGDGGVGPLEGAKFSERLQSPVHVEQTRDKSPSVRSDEQRPLSLPRSHDSQRARSKIQHLIRDLAVQRYEETLIDLDPERCFDDRSLHWYRRMFHDRNPDHDPSQTNVEFLHHWGLVASVNNRLQPTHAAILLFGTEPAFRQIQPRPVVDMQLSRRDWSEVLPEQRWADRLVIEVNLVETWRKLMDLYLRWIEKPRSVDPETLQSIDRPPAYTAFREAAINLLVHQDYSVQTCKAAIQFFNDCVRMWNPGDAFASADELLESGETEVRNPRIAAAFRRIGFGDQAGSGIRAIFCNWRQLGRIPPIIDNDRVRKTFQLTFFYEDLLSEEQIRFQGALGIHLDDAEAKVLALARRNGKLSLRDVRVVAGASGSRSQEILDRLVAQGLISPLKGTEPPAFVLAEHLRVRLERNVQGGRRGVDQADQGRGQGSEQASASLRSRVINATQVLSGLDGTARKILTFCESARSTSEIVCELGSLSRSSLCRNYLEPLLADGLLRRTHPTQPRHPHQAYARTEAVAVAAVRLYEADQGSNHGGDQADQASD